MDQFEKIGRLKAGKKPTLLQEVKGNELIDALNALRPLLDIRISPEDAGSVHYSEKNVVIKVELKKSASEFALTDFSLYDAGDGKIGIKVGTVNGRIPTGMSAGGDPAYTVDVTGQNGVAYLIVTASKLAGVTSLTLGNGEAMPGDIVATGAGTGTYYASLGTYDCDETGVLSIGAGAVGIGSQTFSLCRDFFTLNYDPHWEVV